MSWNLILMLSLGWGLFGPFAGIFLMDSLEKFEFYRERCHVLRWIPLFVAGPISWGAAANRIIQSDLRRYRGRQTAQELILAVKESAESGKLGNFTYKDGRLIERRLTAFVPRILEKDKPYMWEMNPDGNARMTVGDHASEDQVTSFICTRDTIVNQLKNALGAGNHPERDRWQHGLDLFNRRRAGYLTTLNGGGESTLVLAEKGEGRCLSCDSPVMNCMCRTSEINEAERRHHGA